MALILVTKSKPVYGNVLAYDNKTHEYVYLHKRVEIERKHSIDGSLCAYFIKVRSNDTFSDDKEIRALSEASIYEWYSQLCQKS